MCRLHEDHSDLNKNLDLALLDQGVLLLCRLGFELKPINTSSTTYIIMLAWTLAAKRRQGNVREAGAVVGRHDVRSRHRLHSEGETHYSSYKDREVATSSVS